MSERRRERGRGGPQGNEETKIINGHLHLLLKGIVVNLIFKIIKIKDKINKGDRRKKVNFLWGYWIL